MGNIIIDSELLNNVINEINPETLVEWYCLTQYDIKTMQNRLESYDSETWHRISHMPLPDDFIRVFKHKLDWKWISAIQQLNENFIEEFQDYVEWNEISQSQNFSESFISEFQNKVNWRRISMKQNISEDFIWEFQHDVAWNEYLLTKDFPKNLSKGFRIKFTGLGCA